MPAVTVPVCTTYFQFDQQGVVFNMWYFGWFDDAMTQLLTEVGYPYTELNADGQSASVCTSWTSRPSAFSAVYG